jgi:hypothetical protein
MHPLTNSHARAIVTTQLSLNLSPEELVREFQQKW